MGVNQEVSGLARGLHEVYNGAGPFRAKANDQKGALP